MGYYTRYSLEIIEGNDYITDYKKEISKLSGFSFVDSCTWYDHDKDMIEYSKKYPNVVFCLSGEGQDTGDLWKSYYKNGLVQRCKAKIVYDNYNESQLK